MQDLTIESTPPEGSKVSMKSVRMLIENAKGCNADKRQYLSGAHARRGVIAGKKKAE